MGPPSQCAWKGQHLDSSPPWSSCIFVWSGYYNKAWGLPNSRKGFLTILEAEKSKISCHQIQCLVRACFPLRQFFTVSSQRKRGQEAFSGLFYKDTNPIHKTSSLMTDHHTEVPSPNTITLGHRIQQMNLGRAHIPPVASQATPPSPVRLLSEPCVGVT